MILCTLCQFVLTCHELNVVGCAPLLRVCSHSKCKIPTLVFAFTPYFVTADLDPAQSRQSIPPLNHVSMGFAAIYRVHDERKVFLRKVSDLPPFSEPYHTPSLASLFTLGLAPSFSTSFDLVFLAWVASGVAVDMSSAFRFFWLASCAS